MHNAGFPTIEISHPRDKGEHEIKCHWDLGSKLGLWPICAGPIASTALDCAVPPYAARTAQAGIKVRWKDNNKQSCRSGLPLPLGAERVRVSHSAQHAETHDRLLLGRAPSPSGRVRRSR